jgi:transposase
VETQDYRIFVGIDWGTEIHRVVVLDERDVVRSDQRVPHTAAALGALADALLAMADGAPDTVAIAIEVPRGAVVETLLERGFHVYAVNPKQLERFRERYTVAGAKDDRRDAWVAAHALRTDRGLFRALRVDAPAVIQLRELSRMDEELEAERRRLSNRLRDQLHRVWPALLTLSPAADEPWLWALLQRAPDPRQGRHVPRARIARLLAAARIRRVSTDDVHAALRSPILTVAPGTVEAVREHVQLLVPRLQLIHAQRQACRARIDAVLRELTREDEQRGHRDVTVLRSLPGVGKLVAATMLAEGAGPLAQRDYHALRAHAGTAPVTRQSGKRRSVHMRYGCNQRLRDAVYHWARVSTQHDAYSRTLYQQQRARGLSHGRALRGLADRLLAQLIAMLKTGSVYDPARRRCPAA